MPDKIRLSEQNQENINRISTLINLSGTALGNYLIEKGCKILEENFRQLDKDVQAAFKKALKQANK